MTKCENYKTFVYLLGENLKIYLESNLEHLKKAKERGGNLDLYIGRLHGYMEIIGMIQQQAEADGLTLQDIGLSNFDPEKYIHEQIRKITGN